MTNEEAKIEIEYEMRRMCKETCCELGYGSNDNCDFCNEVEAYILAMKSLKKQMPKKPTQKLNVYLCAECSRVVWRPDRFCSCCGQAIKWEDKD